jgi:hypothetical protein
MAVFSLYYHFYLSVVLFIAYCHSYWSYLAFQFVVKSNYHSLLLLLFIIIIIIIIIIITIIMIIFITIIIIIISIDTANRLAKAYGGRAYDVLDINKNELGNIYIYIHIYIYMRIFMFIYVYTYVFIHIYVYICVYIYVSTYMAYGGRVCDVLDINKHDLDDVYVFMYMYVCYLYIHVHIRACIYRNIYIHILTCMYLYVYILGYNNQEGKLVTGHAYLEAEIIYACRYC